MADLSPGAQAVYDKVDKQLDIDASFPKAAAVAIRAAADEVLPHLEEPDWGASVESNGDIELYADHQRKRAQLLAIADELCGSQLPT